MTLQFSATFRCISATTHLNPIIKSIGGLCRTWVHEKVIQSIDLLSFYLRQPNVAGQWPSKTGVWHPCLNELRVCPGIRSHWDVPEKPPKGDLFLPNHLNQGLSVLNPVSLHRALISAFSVWVGVLLILIPLFIKGELVDWGLAFFLSLRSFLPLPHQRSTYITDGVSVYRHLSCSSLYSHRRHKRLLNFSLKAGWRFTGRLDLGEGTWLQLTHRRWLRNSLKASANLWVLEDLALRPCGQAFLPFGLFGGERSRASRQTIVFVPVLFGSVKVLNTSHGLNLAICQVMYVKGTDRHPLRAPSDVRSLSICTVSGCRVGVMS